MRILTIETATPTESIAVVLDGELVAERTARAGRGRADELVAAVADVLERSSLALTDLDALAVSIGPGRFTGLRVGLATAKGLSAPTGVPVLPIPTLEALAASVRAEDAALRNNVCAMLDARRGEVYSATFGPVGAPERLSADAAIHPVAAAVGAVDASGGAVVFVGTGASLYASEIVKAVGDAARFPRRSIEVPDPRAMAALAERRAGDATADLASIRPVYLRGL